MINRVEKLKELRGQFANARELSAFLLKNNEVKKEIETLTSSLLNRKLGGCGNCYFDAFIELILMDMETIEKKTNCLFQLRRGALLRDIDASKNMTQSNISNELSIYHIKRNKNVLKYFTKYPDNIEDLMKNSEDLDAENETEPQGFTDEEKIAIDEIAKLMANGVNRTNIRKEYVKKGFNSARITVLMDEAAKQ